MFQPITFAAKKAAQVFAAPDVEPEFNQDDAVVYQHLFEIVDLIKELFALFVCAKAENLFNNAAIVPRPIKHHDFARRWQVFDVALEIPFGSFGFCGF